MTDEFRTPYDSGYVAAIGRAIFIFANYEWTVVRTMERLRPGFLNKWRFAKNPITAGTVGKKFKNAVSESSNLAGKTRTWSLAQIDDLAHRFENSSTALRDLIQEF